MKRLAKIVLVAIVFMFSTTAMAEEALLSAPFMSQVPPGNWQYTRNCGPASALMLAGYYLNFTPGEDDLSAVVDWLYDREVIAPQAGIDSSNGNYTDLDDLKYLLEDYFDLAGPQKVYAGEAKQEFIKEQIRRGNPVIAAVRLNMKATGPGHFMLVIGFDDQGVIVHDPGHSAENGGLSKHYSYSEFLASWASWSYAALHLGRFASWHPDGTLIKGDLEPKVYVLLDGAKHWVVNWEVFLAHGFDSNLILEVSQTELDCYPESWTVDWQPYREVFRVAGASWHYLLEKQSANDQGCMIYKFASALAAESWGYLPEDMPVLSASQGQQKLSVCDEGGILHIRDGRLVKPEPALTNQGFGQGAVFVISGNGVARPFANFQVFSQMGYASGQIWTVDAAQMLMSVAGFGDLITVENINRCFANPEGGGNSCLDGDELETYSGSSETVNVGSCRTKIEECFAGDWHQIRNEVLPISETADGLDNDCDGETDEDFSTPVECEEGQIFSAYSGSIETFGIGPCRPEISVCQSGHWVISQDEVLPEPEQNDGQDNDCDGLTDDGWNQYPDPPQDDEECVDHQMQTSYSEASETIGVGECRPRIEYCDNGVWQTIQDEVLPSAEVEDNADNNCDGQTDEDFSSSLPPQSSPDQTPDFWAAKSCGQRCLAFNSQYLTGKPNAAFAVGELPDMGWSLQSGMQMAIDADGYYRLLLPANTLAGQYSVSYMSESGAWAQYGDSLYDDVGPFRRCGFDGSAYTCGIKFSLTSTGDISPSGG